MIEGVVALRNGYITKALNGSINDCWAKTASGFLSKNMYPNDYRINVLFNALQKLTDTYEYNFELCCKAIANAKWTARPLIFCHKIINLHPSINFSMFFIFVSTLSLLYSRNKGIAFAGFGLIVFGKICIFCICSYYRRQLSSLTSTRFSPLHMDIMLMCIYILTCVCGCILCVVAAAGSEYMDTFIVLGFIMLLIGIHYIFYKLTTLAEYVVGILTSMLMFRYKRPIRHIMILFRGICSALVLTGLTYCLIRFTSDA